MITFYEFICLQESYLDLESAKRIVMDALGVDENQEDTVMNTQLKSYDPQDLKKILDDEAVQSLSNFQEIEAQINTDITVGELVQLMSQKA